MWRFVSAARMAQIKADARAEGYIKAVREGLAANDAAKEDRIVTSETTQTANTAVQEVQSVVDKRPRPYIKKRAYKLSKYSDANISIFEDGRQVELLIEKNVGTKGPSEIANEIRRTMGTHVKGAYNPIKVTSNFVHTVIARTRVWESKRGYFRWTVNKT